MKILKYNLTIQLNRAVKKMTKMRLQIKKILVLKSKNQKIKLTIYMILWIKLKS
jgi:hypothetical protein